MYFHIPDLMIDLSQPYYDLFRELEVFLKSAPLPFVELHTQGKIHKIQTSAQQFLTEQSFLSLSLSELYSSTLFTQGQDLSLPNNIGLLCCNQIFHRTPNPNDILRPLLRLVDLQGYAVIIELEPSSHNPYPPKTPGVFSYGTSKDKIYSSLEQCYFETIKYFYIKPLNAWVAKWMS